MVRHYFVAGLLITAAGLAQAYPGGIAGRTLKSTTAGCGGNGCHGSAPSADVSISIDGPDTLAAGATAAYTVMLTGTAGTKGGIDIAARTGSLLPVSPTVKTLDNEVVHRQRSSSPYLYTVLYTAPAAPGRDTLYAVGKDNGFNSWNHAPKKPLVITTATGVGDDPSGTPCTLALLQNYPNPFNPTTNVAFSVPRSGHATLRVYSLLGREVATLVDGPVAVGMHTVSFDAGALSGGIYVYVLSAGGTSVARKMVILK